LGVQFAKYVGFKVAAIARGPFKAEVAKRLGVHFYIDSAAQDVAAELQKLGGASVILATAANSESQSRLVGGLMPRGELVIAGPGGETPLAINGLSLIIGEGSVNGTLTGSSHDSEATLAFSALQGIRAMVETMPLIKAEEAYRRMLSNQARFRMVLVTGQ
jgi:alcohol dehydrogenase, propanol-preferring